MYISYISFYVSHSSKYMCSFQLFHRHPQVKGPAAWRSMVLGKKHHGIDAASRAAVPPCRCRDSDGSDDPKGVFQKGSDRFQVFSTAKPTVDLKN